MTRLRLSGAASRRLGLLAFVLVLAATPAVAGCGGSDEESAGEQWAGDVCGQLSTWVTQVGEAVTSFTEGGLTLDAATVQAATEDVTEATDELVEELGDLGAPETEAGEEARDELHELATGLTQQLHDLEQAVETGSLSLVDITSALAAASAAVRSSFESIQSLDGGDELRNGFEDAEACDSLRQQVDTIGD